MVWCERPVEDETAFLHGTVDSYGMDGCLWKFVPIAPNKAENPLHEPQVHFRNARTDSRRDAFTAQQTPVAGHMMPEASLRRFGWPRR